MKKFSLTILGRLFFCGLFALLFSCSKTEKKGCMDTNALNYDQTANQEDNSCSYSLSAKVNDVLFGNSAGSGNLVVQYGNESFFVLAYDRRISGEVSKQIVISYSPLSATGTYVLNTEAGVISPQKLKYGGYIEDAGGANQTSYATDSTRTGTLVITKLDTINKLFSSTFNFTAEKNGGTAIVNVTDGQFTDLEY